MESGMSYVRTLDNHTFVYPRMDIQPADLCTMIAKNKSFDVSEYSKDKDYYLGKHEILKDLPRTNGPDYRLIVNMPYYIVNTFNGYFLGNAPTFSLQDDTQSDQFNDWLSANSFVDVLNEVSKQVDITGRAYIYVYQDEDAETKVAYVGCDESFMVYDDTIQHKPLAFVRYWTDYDGSMNAEVCYRDKIQTCNESGNVVDERINPYGMVPAVEFFANEERQSIFGPVKTLCDALDRVMSSKSNQVAYFDNAYLKILGLDLSDEDGNVDLNLKGNQVIYCPDEEAANGTVEFVEKPDGDTQQEHLIDRLVNMIYQNSMVANLNDEVFSGNSSGVALEYKLLPMKNLAANKERKFTQELRQLFKVVLSAKRVISNSNDETFKDIDMVFTRNVPVNLDSEAGAVQKLTGITSKETQLAQLSFVKDPKKEMDKIEDEQRQQVEQAVKNNASAIDLVKTSDVSEEDDERVADTVIKDESKDDE